VEWAPHGIRVNGVAFGPVLTDASRFRDAAIRTAMEASLPGGRIATAEEVAQVVLSLADIDSAAFTGETVRVDGGFRSVLQSPLET
jgi:3-oxoacyl-[acyl-carrier protein] reductase